MCTGEGLRPQVLYSDVPSVAQLCVCRAAFILPHPDRHHSLIVPVLEFWRQTRSRNFLCSSRRETPHQRCTMPTTKVCLWILLLKRSLLKHNPKYANRVCAFRYNETSTKVVKRILLCMHSARKISRYWLPTSGGVPVISGSPRFARGRNPGTIAKGRRGALTAGPTPNANSKRRVPWGA